MEIRDGAAYLEEMSAKLLSWYDKSARKLPWRADTSPYHVWISEIMLQQTRIEAAIPYYEKFIAAAPDAAALASLTDDALLKLWEGLGYYSRARNLKKAAVMITKNLDGVFPDTREELLTLPGIGPYTAGAIASIAFGRAAPAVDGNVLRVFSRLLASRADIKLPAVRKAAETLSLKIMPEDRPGAFNQALMELGELICLPNGAAKCGECPLAGICFAEREGLVKELPFRSKAKERAVEDRTILILASENRVFIRTRENKGLLAGLCELPSVKGRLSASDARRAAADMGLCPAEIEALPEAKHVFSHIEWRMTGFLIWVDEPGPEWDNKEGLIPAGIEELKNEYPIPSAFRFYMEIIESVLKKADNKE